MGISKSVVFNLASFFLFYLSFVPYTVAQSGSISGRVVNDLGEPLSGIVQCYEFASHTYLSTQTDQDGNYSFTDLPDSAFYTVSTKDMQRDGIYYYNEGYDPNGRAHCFYGDGAICFSASTSATWGVNYGTPISISNGEAKSNIDFELGLTGTVSGVVMQNGYPLGSVSVLLAYPDGRLPRGGPHILTPVSAVTDAAGSFSMTVPYGRFIFKTAAVYHQDEVYSGLPCEELVAPNSLLSCSLAGVTEVAISRGSNTASLSFDLEPSATPIRDVSGKWIKETRTQRANRRRFRVRFDSSSEGESLNNLQLSVYCTQGRSIKPGDRVCGSATIATLQAGKSKTVKLRLRPSKRTKYYIASIDPSNAEAESNEANNVKVVAR